MSYPPPHDQPPGSPPPIYVQMPPALPSGMGVASMVCGILAIPTLSFAFLCLPVSPILAIIALCLGVAARGRVRRGVGGGGGMATAGIVCGTIALSISAIVILVELVFFLGIVGAGAAGTAASHHP